MSDQLVASIAIVLVTKGAEALASGAKSAIAGLYRVVRSRLAENPADSAALEVAVEHPDDRWRQVELAAVLARTMARDEAFEQAVRAQWSAAQAEMSVTRGGVVNQFSGRAEKVVQARDISGDVTF